MTTSHDNSSKRKLYRYAYKIGSMTGIGRFTLVKKIRKMLLGGNNEAAYFPDLNCFMYSDEFDTGDIHVGTPYEPAVMRTLKSIIKPNDICLDLGANVGIYAVLFGLHTAHTYAFEPASRTYAVLQHNIQLNNLESKVTANCAAVSNSSKKLNLNISYYSSASSSFVQEAEGTETVDCVRLDDYFKGKKYPTVIKMDVEGWESEAIEGGRQVFASASHIIFENNEKLLKKRGRSFTTVPGEFASMGFEIEAIDSLNMHAYKKKEG
jgi:FkbM family methyltransferase